ncbi:NIPSNAP family protein [Sphingobium lactosutens]|uniref:NIPSNAP family protein n=1 Tax=Sphingobium lactosutens TaxID=522773 RepID=UPI0015B7B336|nr:NIPSNAP family protein [Sphingobium lactosutens]
MILLQSTIFVRPGKMAIMLDIIRNRLVPILQDGAGWKLLGCYEQRVGRLNTIVDLWELTDYNHFTQAFAAYRSDPDYPAIRILIDECVEQETLVFLEKRF